MAQVGFGVVDVQVEGCTGSVKIRQRKESWSHLFLSPCICWEIFEQVAQSHQEQRGFKFLVKALRYRTAQQL